MQSGTGWTCSISGQTVSCTRSDSLAAASSYPSITLNVAVSQSAPATVTNTAVVGGGGEANLLNDTATDTANVVSSADMSVTDAGSPNPVAAGANITYTQVVTNNGPSAADNATVVATIPANTTLVSIAAPAGWSCLNTANAATGNVVCTNANMAALTSGTFTLVVKVNSADGKRNRDYRDRVGGFLGDRSEFCEQYGHGQHARGRDWAELVGDERGLAESGAGREQHYLYAGGDEYRYHGHNRRHVHRDGDAGCESDIRFGYASSRVDLHRIPGEPLHEPERGRRCLGNIHGHL